MDKNGPLSVGIIMDGNRRWAKARGFSTYAGHEAGKKVLFDLLDDYRALREAWGTAHYIFYTFSTENWSRAEEEVASLLGLFEKAFEEVREKLPRIKQDGVAVRFIGDRSRFSESLQSLMGELERETAGGQQGTFAFALSYGGRAEIVHAVNRVIEKEFDTVTEELLAQELWTSGIPDPDLIIRTAGEERLSNFLPWQSVYSEFAFTDLLWPDFSRVELERIFSDYSSRERRHGK